MTDSKTYEVRGAEVITTANLYPHKIDLQITVDLSNLDKDEPDHSFNNLMEYIKLNGYATRDTYIWCKLHRKVTVKTGAQAHRVIKHALAKIDDAIAEAVIARNARKQQMANVFNNINW